MFDDTQVQSLAISWLDTYDDPSFTVVAKSSPDDFLLKPIEFYEMPDGLWYPQGRFVWSNGGKDPLPNKDHFIGLSILEMMSSVKKRGRDALRRAGSNRPQAYQKGHYFSSLAWGFHRSRVSDGGFPLHPRKEWQAAREAFKGSDASAMKEIEEALSSVRSAYEDVVKALAGRGPDAKE
jgi:hypothetical protein